MKACPQCQHPVPAGRRLLLPRRRGARRASATRSSAATHRRALPRRGRHRRGRHGDRLPRPPQARRPAVRREGDEPARSPPTRRCASASGARPRARRSSPTRTSSRSSIRARRADGTPYIVMELLDGKTLADAHRRRARSPRARGVPIMIQIARGIARAHDLGVVHRDLKPENIFICRRADGSRPREDPRLRHRALAQRLAPDQRRGALRHAAVPGARAHHGRRDRAERRPLRARGHLLRDDDGQAARSRRATRRRSSSST